MTDDHPSSYASTCLSGEETTNSTRISCYLQEEFLFIEKSNFSNFFSSYQGMKLEQVKSMVCQRQLYYLHMLLPSQEIERVQDAIGMSYFSDLIHRFKT